jgi:hypothetical protein
MVPAVPAENAAQLAAPQTESDETPTDETPTDQRQTPLMSPPTGEEGGPLGASVPF